MELYIFGHDPGSQFQAQPGNRAAVSVCAHRAKSIEVLWTSWCDAVIAHENDLKIWGIEYRGTGLTKAQKEQIRDSFTPRLAVAGGHGRQYSVDYFGTAMADGLRGYLSHGANYADSKIVLFATELEMEAGVPEIQIYSGTVHRTFVAIAMRMGSNDDVLVTAASPETSEQKMFHFKHLDELRNHLDTSSPASPIPTITFPGATQFCVNATTFTALDSRGFVHTATRDPRYPKCLGRPHDNTFNFQSVPYLSETEIQRIAAGGYMTAAVSVQGELFLWGQACPGSIGELSVLKEHAVSNDSHEISSTSGISAEEEEQDDVVKCLTVHIDGETLHVYSVAIGHGHVLVAAEKTMSSGVLKRVVFAAGENGKGQLGCCPSKEHLQDFEEVRVLRGRRIEQLATSGWSTYIVTSGGGSTDSGRDM